MGVFLLFVTLVLEGAGALWTYYYGSHVAGGLAALLTSLFATLHVTSHAHLRVTTSQIGWAWVALYVLVHVAAIMAYIKHTTNKRLKLGRPGLREIRAMDQIYQQFATASPPVGLRPVGHLRWPRSFNYTPGYDLTLSFLGLRLIIDEGLLTHRSLKPLLAQQLFAYNSGDVWLRVVLGCLEPLTALVLPLCALAGLPIGIGPVVTWLLWKKYWRDRVSAADVFAARLGQAAALIEAIDHVVRPRERRKNLLLRESPYAAERIDRLMRLTPAGYSRAYAKTSTSGEGAYHEWSFPHPEDATSGYSSGEIPPLSKTPPSEMTATIERGTFSTSQFRQEKTSSSQDGPSSTRQSHKETMKMPETNFERWLRSQSTSQPRSGETRTASGPTSASASDKKRPPQGNKREWNPLYAESVSVILKYADAGWHVRWETADTEAFWAVLDEFKARLSKEYYWDPCAFDEKGGWWVSYGALASVGDLFGNYQEAREELERAHRKQYEEQRQRTRERSEQEQREKGQQQHTSSKQGRQTHDQSKQENKPPKQQEKREEVKLPRTSQEALAMLSLVPPVTLSKVKRAYRQKAKQCHPDHGGSHAQMVMLNAAFELAQKVAS